MADDTTSKDYYELLGVHPKADQEQIKSAYWREAKRWHPDHDQGDAERFRQVKDAYDKLSDPTQREAYDRWHAGEDNGATAPDEPGSPPEPYVTPEHVAWTFDGRTAPDAVHVRVSHRGGLPLTVEPGRTSGRFWAVSECVVVGNGPVVLDIEIAPVNFESMGSGEHHDAVDLFHFDDRIASLTLTLTVMVTDSRSSASARPRSTPSPPDPASKTPRTGSPKPSGGPTPPAGSSPSPSTAAKAPPTRRRTPFGRATLSGRYRFAAVMLAIAAVITVWAAGRQKNLGVQPPAVPLPTNITFTCVGEYSTGGTLLASKCPYDVAIPTRAFTNGGQPGFAFRINGIDRSRFEALGRAGWQFTFSDNYDGFWSLVGLGTKTPRAEWNFAGSSGPDRFSIATRTRNLFILPYPVDDRGRGINGPWFVTLNEGYDGFFKQRQVLKLSLVSRR